LAHSCTRKVLDGISGMEWCSTKFIIHCVLYKEAKEGTTKPAKWQNALPPSWYRSQHERQKSKDLETIDSSCSIIPRKHPVFSSVILLPLWIPRPSIPGPRTLLLPIVLFSTLSITISIPSALSVHCLSLRQRSEEGVPRVDSSLDNHQIQMLPP
jgi:hypothetical protein